MNGTFPRFFIAGAVLLAVSTSIAQQASSDAGFIAPKPRKTRVEAAPLEKDSAYDVTGVSAQAAKMKNPLELINPLAPAKYVGTEDVSWDPDNPEKPKGIILLGIQW